MYEYGADEVALMPLSLSPKDVSDKLLLLISKGNKLPDTNDLV